MGLTEASIHEPDDLGKVGARQGFRSLMDQGQIALVAQIFLHAAIHIMVAHMNDAKAQRGRLPSDFRDKLDSAHRHFGHASFKNLIIFALRHEAIDFRLLGVALEQGADSVVRSKSLPVDHGGPDELLVDSPPVAMLRQVAFRQRELLHELCLQRISEELLRELYGERGALYD